MPRAPTQSGAGGRLEKREDRPPGRLVPQTTRSLRLRLALVVLAIAFPAIFLLAFLSLYSAEKELARELVDRGESTARWLDDWFGSADPREPKAFQAEVDRLTRARIGLDEIQIFLRDQDGDLNCVASRNGALRIAASANDRRAVTQDRVLPPEELFRPSGERYLDISAPIHSHGNKEVIGALHLEVSLRDADAMIGEARRNLLLAALGALGLTGFALFFLLDRAIGRPVEDIVAAMERARQGDLTATVEVRTLDELGWLGENFNRMLRRLREKDEELAKWNTELERQVAAATAELEQANHRLFDAQRALSSSERLASLGQLASNIAHEIGTPLNSIYGHIQLLGSEELPESAKSRVSVVETQVERLTAIIQNVLKTLRPPEAQLREVMVNPIVEGVATFMRPVADRASIELALDLARDLPYVYVDSGQLEQVFLNLFTNALDAMPKGGKLKLATARAKDDVKITFTDTGVGIAPENLHRIFEPFFSTKERGHGTGLGLPICQQILRTFRGSLSIESEVGKGSAFTVTLPAVAPEKLLESSDVKLTSSDATLSPTTSSDAEMTAAKPSEARQ